MATCRDLSSEEHKFWSHTGARIPLQLALLISPLYLFFPYFLSQKTIGRETLHMVSVMNLIISVFYLPFSRFLLLSVMKQGLLFSKLSRK